MKVSTRVSIPQPFMQAGAQALERYASPVEGLQLALLATPDGFEIASLRLRGELHVNRLAAMAGSLMAMARAVGREIQRPECKRLTYEADGGVVVFQAVGGAFPCTLCLVLGEQSVLGRALWAANEIAQELAALPPGG